MELFVASWRALKSRGWLPIIIAVLHASAIPMIVPMCMVGSRVIPLVGSWLNTLVNGPRAPDFLVLSNAVQVRKIPAILWSFHASPTR